MRGTVYELRGGKAVEGVKPAKCVEGSLDAEIFNFWKGEG